MSHVDAENEQSQAVFLKAPLHGVSLLEASAGTGKTFTVALLYLRALLGVGTAQNKPLSVKEILVVTFTNAATEELISRIRLRIKEAIIYERNKDKHKDKNEENDAELEQVLSKAKKIRNESEINELLKTALSEISFAHISTIHSFCADIIKSVAIDSGAPLDFQLSTDKNQLEVNIADLWRRKIDLDKVLDQKDGHKYSFYQLVFKTALQKKVDSIKLGEQEICASELSEKLPKKAELENLFFSNEHMFTANYKPAKLAAKINSLYAFADGSQKANYSVLNTFSLNNVISGIGIRGVDKNEKQLLIEKFQNKDFFKYCNKFEAFDGRKGVNKRDLMFFSESMQWLKKRVKQTEEQTSEIYSDRVIQLAAEISNDEKVAQKIREQLPLAIIDEFQDTDPFQYQLFKNVYQDQTEAGLIMVGDPKQSIYGFRGGDIHAYLQAKGITNKTFNLPNNYRSSEQLVNGLNGIFKVVENSEHKNHDKGAFDNQDIEYTDVTAKASEPLIQIKSEMGVRNLNAIEGIYLEDNNQGELSVGHIRSLVANNSARYVEKLLSLSEQHRCFKDKKQKKKVQPGDIVFLVNSHSEGKLIKKALQKRNIPAITQTKESIYQEQEAYDIWLLLRSLVSPEDFSFFKAALMASVNCLPYEQAAHILDDETLLLEWIEFWHDLSQELSEKGPMPALHKWFKAIGANLEFNQTDNDRKASNVMQLLELLQIEYSTLGAGQKLLKYIENAMSNKDSTEDEKVLRLESDDARVKIYTIHASKGLEFPIVLVPFAWIYNDNDRDKLFVAYDKAGKQVAGFAPEYKALKKEANKEESLRRFYVALTRASQHLVLYFIDYCDYRNPGKPSHGYNQSSLGWYFPTNNPSDTVAGAFDVFKQTVAAANRDCVSLNDLADIESHSESKEKIKERKLVNQFIGTIDRYIGTSSFSAITRGYSSTLKDDDSEEETQEPDEPIVAEGRHALAKGAHVGTALHNVLEHTDFKMWQDSNLTKANEQLTQLLTKELKSNGVIYKNQDIEDMLPQYNKWLSEAIKAPFHQSHDLTSGIALKDLDNWLPELEFTFQLNKGFNKDRLRKLLNEHGYQLSGLKGHSIHGMLTGAIDLVFKHNDRYYLADYKSNYLGADYTAYDAVNLDRNNDEKAYTLQYLIYSLALHKHLQYRMPDYDYESHFGGAYYLYIRGMHPDHPEKGIFFHRPPLTVINALDKYLCSTEQTEVPA